MNEPSLSDGPIPPPPLGAWQPTQFMLSKACMPRSIAAGTPAAGFLISAGKDAPPGKSGLTGTCSSAVGAGDDGGFCGAMPSLNVANVPSPRAAMATATLRGDGHVIRASH